MFPERPARAELSPRRRCRGCRYLAVCGDQNGRRNSAAVFVLEEPEADCFFDHRGGVVYVRVWQIQGNLAGLSGEPYRKFLSSESN